MAVLRLIPCASSRLIPAVALIAMLCPGVVSALPGQPGPLHMFGCEGGNPPPGGPCGVIYQDERNATLNLAMVTELHTSEHFNVRWRQGNGNEPQIEMHEYYWENITPMLPLVDYTVKVQVCRSGGIFSGDTCGPWSDGHITGTWFGVPVRLESVNFPGRFVRHQNFLASATEIRSALDENDSLFVVRRGLADRNAVSLESVNFPLSYLRHQDWRVRISDIDREENSSLFRMDATFWFVPGLSGTDASFKSYNYPDRFMRHRGFMVFVEPPSTGGPFNQDATWAVRVAR